MLKIFYSNRIELLYQDLKIHLFENSAPFARRMIIVPTPAIKSWLLFQLAKDPNLGIAAGLEILYLDDALKKLQELLSSKKNVSYIPNPLELTLAIEAQIHNIVSTWKNLSSDEKNVWQPLLDYLKISTSSQNSRRSEKRLAQLAEVLAKLFIDYGKYGREIVKEWGASAQDWQQALWHRLYAETQWSYPSKKYATLDLLATAPIDLQVHLFSISFLPQADYLLFEKCSQLIPLHSYILSPCSLFWSDILSDKEAQNLQKFWSRQGAPLDQQQLLETYLRDKNPLLANWGKLGRKMTECLEKEIHATHTHYALPECLKNHAAYSDYTHEDMGWENSCQTPYLLNYLQADILLMRKPNESEKIALSLEDTSIQLNCAPTVQREVQILYHTLLKIMDQEKNIEPSDILVMAPDIMAYAPYIHQVFGSSESVLDFQVMDMHELSEDSLSKQFQHLIELPFGRWDVEDLMYLFSFSNFQKKHQLAPEDVRQLRTWMEKASIFWGDNSSHRNEILRQRYGAEMVEDTEKGTCEGGFSRLLLGLAVLENPDIQTPVLPLSDIETSQGILLGQWMKLLRSLRQDLKPLTDGTHKTYAEWMQTLKKLLLSYLTDDNQEEEHEDLWDRLDEITLSAKWYPDQKVSFTAVKKHLDTSLSRQTYVYRENHLQAVKFCSMLPMRTIPAKVIALMGLQEGAFPRTDHRHSLNLIKENPQSDYCPSKTDYDRYIFLEALLSARQYFILSYTRYAKGDGKEQAPSLLVEELFSYIDQAYLMENQKVSEKITYSHPYRSFDALYFSGDEHFKNYSKNDYKAALSYYQKEKKPMHHFIHDYQMQLKEYPIEPEILLDIKQIKNALQNPLKNYLNKTLGIYLKEEQELQTEEAFTLNALQLSKIKKSSLKQSLKTVLEKEDQRGQLPLGLFKQTALQKAQKDVDDYHSKLVKMGVDLENVFEITLHEQYETATFDEEGWKLPPLSLKYKESVIKIVGRLSEVASEGLIASIEGYKADVIKGWAEFVILCCLIDKHQLPIQKQLLCSKTGAIKKVFFENASVEVEQILDFYFRTLQVIHPLANEWMYDLIHRDAETLQKSMDKSLNDSFNQLYNEDIRWICRTNTPDAHATIEHLQPPMRSFFSHLYQAWTTKNESL
jgi:exodeoxyribonuclease V gamma subunit